MKFTKVFIGLTIIATTQLQAQEKNGVFSLSGEFRPRTELLNNGRKSAAIKGTDAYMETSARTALNASYKTSSYTMYVSIQEVYQFGYKPNSSQKQENVRLQEAWANVKLSNQLNLKIGRQPLIYDDERILGASNWGQQAKTHDVSVLKYKNKGYSIDAGYAINTNGSNIYNTAANFAYRQMAFLHANKKFKNTNISFLFLNNTFQNNTPNKSNLSTIGLHIDSKIGAINLTANGYLQDGQRAGDVNVNNAYLASLKAGLNLTDKTNVAIRGEVISGKRANGSQGFFPLYGTNHGTNGLMDRFYAGNYSNGNGMVDLSAEANSEIVFGISGTLAAHYFKEQSLTKRHLGNEIDLTLAKQFDGFNLSAGYSQFFEPKNKPANVKTNQNWVWLMLTIKPKFL